MYEVELGAAPLNVKVDCASRDETRLHLYCAYTAIALRCGSPKRSIFSALVQRRLFRDRSAPMLLAGNVEALSSVKPFQ